MDFWAKDSLHPKIVVRNQAGRQFLRNRLEFD